MAPRSSVIDFDGAVRVQQDGAAGRLVDAARLHADEAVLDQVEAADAVVAAEVVERRQQRRPGDSFLPSRQTASPFSKPIVMSVALSGASMRRDGALIDDLAAARLAGSSSTLPSEEECSRLASTENGASPRLSLATGIWCCSRELDQLLAALEAPTRATAR